MKIIKEGRKNLKIEHLWNINPPIELLFMCDNCDAEYSGLSDDPEVKENPGQNGMHLGVHYVCPNCRTIINIFINRDTKVIENLKR